jgi:hypothetical protein
VEKMSEKHILLLILNIMGFLLWLINFFDDLKNSDKPLLMQPAVWLSFTAFIVGYEISLLIN